MRAAIVVENVVVDMRASGRSHSVRSFIAATDAERRACFDEARRALRRGVTIGNVEHVRLGPAVPDPAKIVCLGLNYRKHAEEANLPIPRSPVLFAKYANSLVGRYEDVIVPPVARGAVDYEAELAVVIGATASRVPLARALEYVYGYAVFNDVTARDLQFATSQWGAGKAIDTFGPLGPYIVPRCDVPDPQALTLATTVNGIVVQHATTADMIFSVAETIAYITSFMTLEPGDIIATGTPAGVGFSRTPPSALSDGDVVEVTIETIGSLRNTIVWERSAASTPSFVHA